MLLGSPPDMVHGVPSRRTRTSVCPTARSRLRYFDSFTIIHYFCSFGNPFFDLSCYFNNRAPDAGRDRGGSRQSVNLLLSLEGDRSKFLLNIREGDDFQYHFFDTLSGAFAQVVSFTAERIAKQERPARFRPRWLSAVGRI